MTTSEQTDSRVMKRCNELGAKENRRGDWMHNVYWAWQGMSDEDQDELFRARQHGFDPEFT